MIVERREQLVAARVPHRPGAEIDAAGEKFFKQVAEDVGLDQGRDLIAELERVEDFLNIGREAVQIGFKVGLELLPGAVFEVAQG